jgi:hypothetical protein
MMRNVLSTCFLDLAPVTAGHYFLASIATTSNPITGGILGFGMRASYLALNKIFPNLPGIIKLATSYFAGSVIVWAVCNSIDIPISFTATLLLEVELFAALTLAAYIAFQAAATAAFALIIFEVAMRILLNRSMISLFLEKSKSSHEKLAVHSGDLCPRVENSEDCHYRKLTHNIDKMLLGMLEWIQLTLTMNPHRHCSSENKELVKT